jgi:SAM-dependent methyltransferase
VVEERLSPGQPRPPCFERQGAAPRPQDPRPRGDPAARRAERARLRTHGSPKLLGCYEQEVVALIDRLRKDRFDRVVNVGCAEGFFAVGVALLLAPVQVIAVDTDEAALRATMANAELNGVAARVETRLGIDGKGLAEIAGEFPRCLVISDCEGFETQLFSHETISCLNESTCIIECHDFPGSNVLSELSSRFCDTHGIESIEEGARNPNRYEVLRGLDSMDRWLAVSEGRPRTMRWLVASPLAEMARPPGP